MKRSILSVYTNERRDVLGNTFPKAELISRVDSIAVSVFEVILVDFDEQACLKQGTVSPQTVF